MRRYRPLIGVLMIVMAISLILFWELKGRESVVMETVLVAGAQIEKGAVIEPEMVKAVAVMKETKVPGAMGNNGRNTVLGKEAARRILPNEQFTEQMFAADDRLMAGTAVFQIKPQWIDSRSSSLRKGDAVAVYGAEGEPLLGRFPVAFVKDQHEQEVEDGELFYEDNILKRTSSTSQISHIEIIAELAEYETIRAYASEREEGSLLLVQETEGWRQ